MKYKTGFTLIELLIVITIIGILAAVILPRLQSARDGGVETKIKTEVTNVAKRAAIEQSQGGTFHTVCGTGGETQSPEIVNLFTAINDFASSTAVCNGGSSAFAVSGELATGRHWCVDSLGAKKEVGAALGSGVTVCP